MIFPDCYAKINVGNKRDSRERINNFLWCYELNIGFERFLVGP